MLTVHFIGLLKIFIFFFYRFGLFCESVDIVIQIPAQVLVKHSCKKVKLFDHIFLGWKKIYILAKL